MSNNCDCNSSDCDDYEKVCHPFISTDMGYRDHDLSQPTVVNHFCPSFFQDSQAPAPTPFVTIIPHRIPEDDYPPDARHEPIPSVTPAPARFPHRCPICGGSGGKYTDIGTVFCRACGGAGIVWG